MFDRLAGQETEYALHWVGDGPPVPRSELFDAIDRALQELVATRPGQRWIRRQRFTQYGGSYALEEIPTEPDSGLFEAATPECTSPIELLTYQRMQDELIARAAEIANRRLRTRPPRRGRLVVLRNAMDAAGHRYGPQENYEVRIATGWRRAALLAGLVALTPVVVVVGLLSWLVVLLAVLLGVGAALVLLCVQLLRTLRSGEEELLEDVEARYERWVHRLEGALVGVERVISWPAAAPFVALLRSVAFVPHRRALTAFLLSRIVFTGTGSLDEQGIFHLSEKARGLTGMMRADGRPSSATVFDTGNLLKGIGALLVLNPRGFGALARPRQRMQLSFSDANRCEWAELARIGTTMLMIDLAEAGALDDAPHPSDPLTALRTWNRGEEGFRTEVPLADGSVMSALEVQRWYLERAEAWLAEQTEDSLEARAVLRAWRRALELAETPGPYGPEHPGFGRLDWVTKRALLEHLGPEASPAARKKIDLKYHQLVDGYFEELVEAGGVVRVVDPAALDAARQEPPERSPAHHRGRLVRRLAEADQAARVSWSEVRIGGRLGHRVGAQVIDLSRYRDRRGGDDEG